MSTGTCHRLARLGNVVGDLEGLEIITAIAGIIAAILAIITAIPAIIAIITAIPAMIAAILAIILAVPAIIAIITAIADQIHHMLRYYTITHLFFRCLHLCQHRHRQ